MAADNVPPSPLDAKLLSTLERAFANHAGSNATINLADLQKALGLKGEYIARRVMLLFDTNGDGVISKDEFLTGVRSLIFGTDDEKLRFAFRLHDHDGDGFLNDAEIVRMIAMSLAEGDIAERATQQPEDLARVLMKEADRDGDRRVSFEEFARVVLARPELLRNMTRSEAMWIAPNEELLVYLDQKTAGSAPKKARYASTSTARFVVIAVLLLANVGLFAFHWIVGALDNPPVEPFLLTGRALSRCADLDGALILLPMMRRFITRIRPTWIGRALPVDDAVGFHRFVGHVLFVVGLAHAGAFGTAYALGHSASALPHLLRLTRGWSGVSLLGVFFVMWLFALPMVRRGRRFELFYFSHLLYVVWLVLALFHGPNFWMWAAAPILGFVVEQILRLANRSPSSAIEKSRVLRSGVTRLEIARPEGFTFRPADYCFLSIPSLARHEWHPFTISSAPERDKLVFHVRSLGNWTRALRQHVEAAPDAPNFVAYLDGPYGSPSGHIFENQFAVLIGAGIGVTPFASVLESAVLRAKTGGASKLEKAHFFWLNKDQYSFEWFAELLREIEREDKKGTLDIHLCMTGARSGLSAMGLEIARDLMAFSGRSDLVTGLHTHTHIGPPDWDAMLLAVAKEHAPHPVHAFYCGPPELEAKIRAACARHGMTFRAEKF